MCYKRHNDVFRSMVGGEIQRELCGIGVEKNDAIRRVPKRPRSAEGIDWKQLERLGNLRCISLHLEKSVSIFFFLVSKGILFFR